MYSTLHGETMEMDTKKEKKLKTIFKLNLKLILNMKMKQNKIITEVIGIEQTIFKKQKSNN